MPLTDNDIVFTFSGGPTNADPDLSLGGEPSVQPIVSKRLFDDVSEDETQTGVIDYRCFYVNNESAIYSLYDSQIFVSYTTPGDVTVALGFDFANERQNLTVTNAVFVTSGSFTLTYTDSDGNHDIVVAWNADLATWGGNLQTAIRSINNLENVTISGAYSGDNVIFEIDFVGSAANRYHELIVLKSGGNNLVSSQPTTISIVKVVDGGPINRIADVIDVDTTTPNNVAFTSSVATIGDIRPLDSLPIWVRRTVPADTEALENDGFTLRIKGSAIAP
jgi:hypothetical protein